MIAKRNLQKQKPWKICATASEYMCGGFSKHFMFFKQRAAACESKCATASESKCASKHMFKCAAAFLRIMST